MEEIKINGIVLSTLPYKDNDLLLRIFTPEIGKITCIMKGVKSAKAKLKWAALPFSFCEWVLAKKGEFYVVTNATSYDTFFDLTQNYDNYVMASMLLEIVDVMLKPNILAEWVFIDLINTIKNITYQKNVNAKIYIIKFLLNITSYLGYALSFEVCENCNMPIADEILLSFDSHNFSCRSCCGGYGMLLSRQQYNLLKIINNSAEEKLSSIKSNDEVLLACINSLRFNLECILDYKIKSFKQLVENG